MKSCPSISPVRRSDGRLVRVGIKHPSIHFLVFFFFSLSCIVYQGFDVMTLMLWLGFTSTVPLVFSLQPFLFFLLEDSSKECTYTVSNLIPSYMDWIVVRVTPLMTTVWDVLYSIFFFVSANAMKGTNCAISQCYAKLDKVMKLYYLIYVVHNKRQHWRRRGWAWGGYYCGHRGRHMQITRSIAWNAVIDLFQAMWLAWIVSYDG